MNEMEKCKFCGNEPASFSANMYVKGTTLKCWCVECECEEDKPFPFAEHSIHVYGANKEEAETRWNEINKCAH